MAWRSVLNNSGLGDKKKTNKKKTAQSKNELPKIFITSVATKNLHQQAYSKVFFQDYTVFLIKPQSMIQEMHSAG